MKLNERGDCSQICARIRLLIRLNAEMAEPTALPHRIFNSPRLILHLLSTPHAVFVAASLDVFSRL